MAQAGSNIITLSDVRAIRGGEPRIKDVRLGEALGMAQPINIRKVIEKNLPELQGYGEVLTHRVKTSAKGGRPGVSYHLNEPQALLLCMFSRTAKAAEVRQEIIKVFMAYRHGALKPVRVKEHRRSTARTKIEPVPDFFMPGSNVLNDLHSVIRSAVVRVETGSEPNFVEALLSVLGDLQVRADHPAMPTKKPIVDWNWKRARWRGSLREQMTPDDRRLGLY